MNENQIIRYSRRIPNEDYYFIYYDKVNNERGIYVYPYITLNDNIKYDFDINNMDEDILNELDTIKFALDIWDTTSIESEDINTTNDNTEEHY